MYLAPTKNHTIMNKFKFYFILAFISISLFSCKRDDDNATKAPLRDYAVQYAADIDSIEEYLKTHYITQVEVDGLTDVAIDTLIASNPDGHVSIWDNTDFPLQSKIVRSDSRSSNLVDGEVADPVEYKMYYLILNEGGGSQPTDVDSTFTTYRGWKLDNDEFDSNTTGIWSSFPALSTAETQLISGYRQFVSELKSSTGFTTGEDGTISYTNAGIGVVFIPSGLGYFNASRIGIPAYSPLVFTVRLNSLRYRDHDRDGIKAFNEDINGDKNFFNDDTDGDNIPDFLDVDDDNDDFLTRDEIKNSEGVRYEFDAIPNCQGTTGGLKRYLDDSCHN